MAARSVLVVGAQGYSLGSAIASEFERMGHHPVTAGIAGEELRMDVTLDTDVKHVLGDIRYDTVVYTAAVNEVSNVGRASFMPSVTNAMAVNFYGAMNLLDRWAEQWRAIGWKAGMHRPTFVVVSSNSAHLARSQSLAYCASKAALSMGLRCAARELASTQAILWGVEPGWISDTPMSEEVHARIVGLQRGLPDHRIPGGREVHRRELGRLIAEYVSHEWDWMNGCMLRLDGGEQ